MRSKEDRVCAFDWRYGSDEMRRLFLRENLIGTMKKVELALLESMAEIGLVPKDAVEAVRSSLNKVTAEMVYSEEKKTGHDIATLVFLLGKYSGREAARWIHFGATSYDIVDTMWALIFREALKIVKKKVRSVIEKLESLAIETSEIPMPGRTHGQHATPITLGFKLANYIYEISRSYDRICDLEKRILLVKLGGATGTLASWNKEGLKLREVFARKLGLRYHIISTQIAPRDFIAETACVLSILASQLDRFAVEVRELARPEIGEVWEARGETIGSSAMPHKANPVTAERISGIARALRSLVTGSLENIVLWHERDLSNSSYERFLIPHMFLMIDQVLEDTLSLLSRLRYDPERMKRNLHLTNDVVTAEALMNSLIVEGGLTREEAYKISQKVSKIALSENISFWKAACSLKDVKEKLNCEALKEKLNPENYIGLSSILVKEVIKYSKTILSKC